MPLTKIQSLGITDGTIVNADINASAAIAGTKLTGVGKVLQVVQATKTDILSFSASATYADISGLSASITPSSASSKILMKVSVPFASESVRVHLKLVRGSTDLLLGDSAGSRVQSTFSGYGDSDRDAYYSMSMFSYCYLDSPSTTSSTTYKIQGRTSTSGTFYINRTSTDYNSSEGSRGASTIILMEIAG
jgi:hypothetical protein